MNFALGPDALAAGYRLAAFETIGSTSTEALERASQGDPGRLWVVAGEQTAGRGRRGRNWQTPPGNLAATLLLVFPAPQPKLATLGFAAGLAVTEAIRRCAPEPLGERASGDPVYSRARLKWPNDVILDGAKVAGILLQSVSLPGGGISVAIGIGVNVAAFPQGLPYPATSLRNAGYPQADAGRLFTALSDAWVGQEALWAEGSGFGALRRRWLECAAGVGAPISVATEGEVVTGEFETIDEDGMLVVRSADGAHRRIPAGDVHFGAAATVGR